MDAFNDAAEKKPEPVTTPTAKVLAAIAKTRRHLALRDAALKQDWKQVEELAEAGGDPMHRSHAALDAILLHDTVVAQRLLVKLKIPSYYRSLSEAPFITAAKTGNLETIEDGIARKVSPEVASRALAVALFNKQETIADLLLRNLPVPDMTDKALFGLLINRPTLYDAAVAGRTERKDLPDYIGHFYASAQLKNHDAMEKTFNLMLANKDKLPLYLMMPGGDEFDGGGPYGDIMHVLLQTEDIGIITRFAENFDKSPFARTTMLHIAAHMAEDHPQLLQQLIEKIGTPATELRSVMAGLGSAGHVDAAKYFIENWPDVVKALPAPVLGVLARHAPVDFVKAVEEKGVPLPAGVKERAKLLSSAIMSEGREAETYLLAHTDLTPELLKELQGNHEYKVQKRAAELGGTLRFEKDNLFWSAVSSSDAAIIGAFPRDPAISTETTWKAGGALREVVKRGDMDLLKDIIAHADWTEDSRKQLVRAALKSQDALEVLAETGFLPAALEESDITEIAENGGAQTLAWLETKGICLTEKLAQEALRIAVHRNAAPMVEYLLAKGPDIEKGLTPLIAAIDNSAEEKTMAALEKWSTRGETCPAPAIAGEIAAGGDLFAGDDSTAVRAAYAGRFAEVMRKAAAKAGFVPEILSETKDKYGNTLLDILGAHGRLGEILEPAALWRTRDARAFIEQNTPALYHAQVDYNPLKAALDLIHLQENARNNRFKLK